MAGTSSRDDMIWIAGGTFRMGSADFYPEERPGPRGHRRWLLDRPLRCHQRAVRAIRRGDRLRDLGRAPAQSRGLPRRATGESRPGFDGLPEANGAGRSAQLRQLVGVGARRELASSEGPAQLARRAGAAPGGPRRVRGRRSLRALGGQRAADRGRVGVCRRAADSMARRSPGATRNSPMARPW